MRTALPAFALLVLAACSTEGARTDAAGQDGAIDAAWIARNGPSAEPRDGWVQTVSGWYRSTEACLRYQEKAAAGTPLAAGEGCLEPGI